MFWKFLKQKIGKLCRGLFFSKIVICNVIKKRLWHKWFKVNFTKSFRAAFFIEDLWTAVYGKYLVDYFSLLILNFCPKMNSSLVVIFSKMVMKLGIASHCKFAQKIKQKFRKIKKMDFTQDAVKNITLVFTYFIYWNTWVYFHVACVAVFV